MSDRWELAADGIDVDVCGNWWDDATWIVGPRGAQAVVSGRWVAEEMCAAMNDRLARAEAMRLREPATLIMPAFSTPEILRSQPTPGDNQDMRLAVDEIEGVRDGKCTCCGAFTSTVGEEWCNYQRRHAFRSDGSGWNE